MNSAIREGPHHHQQDIMIFSLRREPPLLVSILFDLILSPPLNSVLYVSSACLHHPRFHPLIASVLHMRPRIGRECSRIQIESSAFQQAALWSRGRRGFP